MNPTQQIARLEQLLERIRRNAAAPRHPVGAVVARHEAESPPAAVQELSDDDVIAIVSEPPPPADLEAPPSSPPARTDNEGLSSWSPPARKSEPLELELDLTDVGVAPPSAPAETYLSEPPPADSLAPRAPTSEAEPGAAPAPPAHELPSWAPEDSELPWETVPSEIGTADSGSADAASPSDKASVPVSAPVPEAEAPVPERRGFPATLRPGVASELAAAPSAKAQQAAESFDLFAPKAQEAPQPEAAASAETQQAAADLDLMEEDELLELESLPPSGPASSAPYIAPAGARQLEPVLEIEEPLGGEFELEEPTLTLSLPAQPVVSPAADDTAERIGPQAQGLEAIGDRANEVARRPEIAADAKPATVMAPTPKATLRTFLEWLDASLDLH